MHEADKKGATGAPSKPRPRFLDRVLALGRPVGRDGDGADGGGERQPRRWWESVGLEVQSPQDRETPSGGGSAGTGGPLGETAGPGGPPENRRGPAGEPPDGAPRAASFLTRAANRVGDALVLGPRPPRSSSHAGALSGLQRISEARETTSAPTPPPTPSVAPVTPPPIPKGSKNAAALTGLQRIARTRAEHLEPSAAAAAPPARAPTPLQAGQRYMPGLDGLRAIAVFAVVAYHLGLSWAPAGLLGVGVFFTLSGYLITDLLLAQWDGAGRLALGNFWVRRARRLLPALFVMLAIVVVWVALLHQSELGSLWGAVGAAVLYVSNWFDVFQHFSYFARFGPPSPLGHLWSLAIEEQFYLVWPWLLWLGLRYVRERRSAITGHARLAGITLAAAGISALAMAVFYQPGVDPTRVYDGTDTRAFALLFGAALAMVWPSRRLIAHVTPIARRLLDGIGVAGLVIIALLIVLTTQYSPFLYRGGIVLLSIATMMTISALVHPATRLGRALGREPLRWLGVRSYAIYLWQFPVITLTTPTSESSVDPLRAILQVGAIVGLAALSWTFVERPIRQGALGRLWARLGSGEWRRVGLPRRVKLPQTPRVGVPRRWWLVGAGAATATVLVAVTLVNIGPGSSGTGERATSPARNTRPAPAGHGARAAGGAHPRPTTVTTAPAPPPTVPVTTTSCRSVVHIGDSTSEGLTSTSYLPDPSQRIDAQYARVGVTSFDSEISGARSVVERYKNEPNADDIAKRLVGQGYHGCWVLALGTNEAADVAVGSNVGLSDRVDRMMADVGGAPVLWVNVKSLLGSSPYAQNNMGDWDNALVKACAKYPNMRIFDWASVVQDSWFISDGIHFTSSGYAARSQMIADALAKAFPSSGAAESPGCLVR
ncbi:MAG TPA: acyltransferase family protein [Acidimicrobiales bacterium]|nr:acyltransferase family protein [Acidimicrobiales bacterium]